MEVIDDLKASIETPRIKQATDGKANATTDGSSTYAFLEKDGAVASHKAVVMDDKKKVGKVGSALGTYRHQQRQEEHTGHLP